MNIFIITKKHISIFIAVICLLIFIFSFYCISAKSTSSFCYENSIFCVSSLSEFKADSSSDIQEKINNIYSSKEKVAYLTFDDGPTKVATTKVLDILKEEDVKATFFVIGYRVKEFPETVKREYEEGHFIANHTYSHKNSKLYQSKDTFLNELKSAENAISEAIGVSYTSHLFRFPNGSKGTSYSGSKKKCIQYLKEINYGYVDWNALNQDSIGHYTASQLLTNLKKSCKNKDSLVILMHDTADVSRSYLALRDSIRFLKDEGYTFKTFEEFIK